MTDAPIPTLDPEGLGDEPNNHAAIGSMTAYRALRYGRHVELILTDLHSYAMQDPTARPEAHALDLPDFPFLMPQEVMAALDGGLAFAGGHPPGDLVAGGKTVANFRKDEPPVTVLGRVQKVWLKRRLAASTATWKVWAATNGTLDMRTDPQNLPTGLTKPWPGKDYATFGGGDFSAALMERAELYDFVRDARVSGFVTVSGDRHSFWAGYAASALPPEKFAPVGVAFIGGSISAPGLAEALEHGLKNHPLRMLYSVDRGVKPAEATINLAIKRGVASALEYARSGDIERARSVSNPDVAPHLEFVDMAGHGYSVVTAGADAIEAEFVCIPRPVTRAKTSNGGPVRYRVVHRAARWAPGVSPLLTQRVIEGDPLTSI